MKTAIKLLPIVLLFLFAACDKENVKVDASSLPGTWKLSESYSSNGSKGSWTKSKDNLVVEFNSDGSFSGNAYPDYVSYSIKDGSTIVLLKKDKTEQNYAYGIKNGVLTMSPSGPIMCIEGCADHFNKIK
jgi:hypothetical protein